MKNKMIFSVLICSLLLALHGSAQFYNKEVTATINLKFQEEKTLEITGSAENKTQINKSLRYVLSVIKSDRRGGNSNKNNQEGRFVLEPNGKTSLSQTTVNIVEDDRTIVLLLIYDEKDKILGKDRKVLNGLTLEQEKEEVISKEKTESNNDIKKSGDDGFILRGMVVEDTKTKAGSDFYDFFYSLYLSNNINGEKIIKIQEKLAIANNTQIEVLAGEDVIARFIINPRSQYLRTMAEQTLIRVNSYFQRLETTKDQIKRY